MTENDESVLVSAAKAIGTVAGKVASLVGTTGGATVNAQAAPAPKVKKGKLAPKNKQRLPRKEKKLAKKQAAAIQA